MNNEINYKYIDNAEEHPCIKMIGRLLYCEKLNRKSFVAKLIAINGEMLVFQSKNGKIILDRFDSLSHISEYVEHHEPVTEAV
jgi:hypothetical protein